MTINLFFGTGAGRCGTMTLANLLNSEAGVTCLHEGKFRDGEAAGEKLLPFLTLQNRQAYEKPEIAGEMFARYRGDMPAVGEGRGDTAFGDVAYNYVPFVEAIPTVLPDARIFAVFRSGVDFVSSATALSGEDSLPLGWPPRDKPLGNVERFVGMGRWFPLPGTRWAKEWEDEFDHFERNAWLWAETNRVLLDALDRIDPVKVMRIRFEDFFPDIEKRYADLRAFLGISGELPAETRALLRGRPINSRPQRSMPPVAAWTGDQRRRFLDIAGDVMQRLDYSLELQ